MNKRHSEQKRLNQANQLWHQVIAKLSSLWLGSLLMMLMLIALGFATAFESAHGTPAALSTFYYSWWFETLLGALGVNILAAILARWQFLRRKLGFLATHLGIIVILVGAVITSQVGIRGQLTIPEGGRVGSYLIEGTSALVARFPDSPENLSYDLTSWIKNGDHGGDNSPTLSHKDITIRVKSYLPDSRWSEKLTAGDSDAPEAISVVMKRGPATSDDVVFEGRSAVLLDQVISFRKITDAGSLRRMLNTDQGGGDPHVLIRVSGQEFKLPLENGIGKDVPLKGTEYVAQIKRYLPHASVGSGNTVVNLSDEPLNPYAEVIIRRKSEGPEKGKKYKTFARFPEFGSMHNNGTNNDASVTLVVPTANKPVTPIEILEGPDGRLYIRFSKNPKQFPPRQLRIGEPISTPLEGASLTVLSFEEHGKLDRILERVQPERKESQPGIVIELARGTATKELGLRQFDYGSVHFAGTIVRLGYSAVEKPLGFEIELDDFRIGHHPGTMRPRSFTSKVRFIAEEDKGASDLVEISMNQPASFGDFTFFQSSYSTENGRESTVLSVARDPGQWVVFSGYILTLLGMIIVFIQRATEGQHREIHSEECSGGN